MLKPLLWLIALSQFALAALTLFAPVFFLTAMGLTPPPPDNGYLLAMLGARFLAYGLGMAMLARQAAPSRFWLANMALIQAVDFLAGAAYVALGLVSPATAAFPMANAALFTAGLVRVLSRRAGTVPV